VRSKIINISEVKIETISARFTALDIKKYYPYILLGLSVLVHFVFFGHPSQIVFDEVTFGKFIQASWLGNYYFDLHPPLGKWLLTIGSAPFSMDASFVFDRIGSPYKDYAYLGMRAMTTLSGTFLPLLIYYILNRLQSNSLVSFVAGLFVIFENNLLVTSRFFMLDIFLLFFGFAAVLLYLKCREKFTWKLWVLTAIIAVSAFLIKWTAASFLAFIVMFELLDFIKGQNRRSFKKRLIVFCGVAFAFYFLIFAIHFELLPNTGQGDDFMSPQFQKELVGSKFYNNSNYESLNTIGKFIELNYMLWRYHQTMHQNHPYSSSAIEWLWMKRPIYYWEDGAPENKARIYLLGNPFLWWAGSVAIFFLLSSELIDIKSKWQKLIMKNSEKIEPSTFILILFAANYLPFFLISRVMFIYHYNVALVVSLMALAFVSVEVFRNKYLLGLTCFLGIGMFLFFAPLSYGLSLSSAGYQLRLWFPTWL
jgi:dolichyl-phosphate-mannose-protein mannosyltransferase